MTTPAPTVVKTITAAEIRDVTHYCHFIAARHVTALTAWRAST